MGDGGFLVVLLIFFGDKYAHLGIIVRFTLRIVGDRYARGDGRRRLRRQQGGSDLMSFLFARR